MLGLEWNTVFSAGIGTIFGLVAKEFFSDLVRRHQKLEMDRDSDVGEIHSAIEMIRDLSDEFWIHDAIDLAEQDEVASGRLTAALHQNNLLITGLFTGDAKRRCDIAHMRFMDAVGGGDFGQSNRKAAPQRLRTIHIAALNLKDVVRRERRKLKSKFLGLI